MGSAQGGPIRFLESPPAIEVEWPGDLEVPAGIGQAEIGSLAPPGRIARVAMRSSEGGRDNRAALLAPTGSRYRYRLQVPIGGRLRLGLGYVLPQAGAEAQAIFRVSLFRSSGLPSVLLEEAVTTQPDGAWSDRVLSLAAWAGAEVLIELEIGGVPGQETVWAAWSAPELVSDERPEEIWDVVLIVLDTLRADHLGCYGYRRPTSPSIDAFAASAVRFATAVSQSPWTRPAHRALFSGVYPISRGEPPPPLAAELWRAGYQTVALTGGGQVDDRFGFHRGFEFFQTKDWIREPDFEDTLSWLEEARDGGRFLFLHTYEIHDPYRHDSLARGLPQGRVQVGFSREDWERFRKGGLSQEEKDYVKALYDSGIAYTDLRLGRLLAELESRGILDRAMVILTSDHGEQFWEHGTWRHGQTMYDHQLLVPLIVHLPPGLRRQLERRGGPSLAGRVVEQQVQLVDLYPTILDLIGAPSRHRLQSRSLRPLLAGRDVAEWDAFAENTNIEKFERKALRSQGHKLVYSYEKKSEPGQRSERFDLYNLRQDPGEKINLASDSPELMAALRRRLEAILSGGGAVEPEHELAPELDPDLQRRLEALGYVDAKSP